jgi:hypothetical protein
VIVEKRVRSPEIAVRDLRSRGFKCVEVRREEYCCFLEEDSGEIIHFLVRASR